MCTPVHVDHISCDQYNQQQTTQSILVYYVDVDQDELQSSFMYICRYIEFMNVNEMLLKHDSNCLLIYSFPYFYNKGV